MILVTGATGNVGGHVVSALLARDEQVRALTRDGNAADLPEGVEAATGDLNQPGTLSAALDGVQGVFLLSGYADMPGVMNEIQRAGVGRTVLLTSGAAAGGDLTNAVARYHILSENALRESAVAGTILRPSGFMSNALRWLPQLTDGDVVRAPWADVPVAAIDPADIAAVAAKTVTEDGHEGAIYRLTGPEPLVPADQIGVLGAVLDRKLRFEGQSDEAARAEMNSQMPSEYVDAFFSFFSDGTYDDSKVLPTVSQLTGRAPRTFRQWATDHADLFR